MNLIQPLKYLLKHEKRRKHSKASIFYQDQEQKCVQGQCRCRKLSKLVMLCYVTLDMFLKRPERSFIGSMPFSLKNCVKMDAVIEDVLKKIYKMNHRRLLGLSNIFCGALKRA